MLSIQDLLDEMGIAGRTAAFLAFNCLRFVCSIEVDASDATVSSKYLENDRLSSVGRNVAWPRSLDVFWRFVSEGKCSEWQIVHVAYSFEARIGWAML